MKKTFIFILIGILAFTMTACKEQTQLIIEHTIGENNGISSIYVDYHFRESPELSPRTYTTPEKINIIVDYINNLDLGEEVTEKDYNGTGFLITVIYDDGTKKEYYYFGDAVFGHTVGDKLIWQRVDYWQALKIYDIIRDNRSD